VFRWLELKAAIIDSIQSNKMPTCCQIYKIKFAIDPQLISKYLFWYKVSILQNVDHVSIGRAKHLNLGDRIVKRKSRQN